MGLPRNWIGLIFLLATVGLYAGIGIMSRTTDAAEYYVAGRRVPAIYNGMATGADWMSAASFIAWPARCTSPASAAWPSSSDGPAATAWWRCSSRPTCASSGSSRSRLPGGAIRRPPATLPGIIAAILCSFTYVVAQIYGVGVITARLSGLAFEIGIFVGLGGILVCSFLGGMRAVTWTQVAQYIILIIAYLTPVVWLGVKQSGVPVPQFAYGYKLEQITAKEKVLIADPKEQQVIAAFKAKGDEFAAKLKDVPAALAADRASTAAKLAELKAANAPLAEVQAAEKAVAAVPKDEAAAKTAWTAAQAANAGRAKPLGGMPPHAQVYAGDPNGDAAAQKTFDVSRRNFLALVFCLMIGTAALPHILMRYYTTPSVKEARQSVFWSLFFIFLLYFTAPRSRCWSSTRCSRR